MRRSVTGNRALSITLHRAQARSYRAMVVRVEGCDAFKGQRTEGNAVEQPACHRDDRAPLHGMHVTRCLQKT